MRPQTICEKCGRCPVPQGSRVPWCQPCYAVVEREAQAASEMLSTLIDAGLDHDQALLIVQRRIEGTEIRA